VDHVVPLLLLLGDDDLVAEVHVAHAGRWLAVDLGDLVAVLEAGEGAGRGRLHVLDEVGALVDEVGLVELEAQRVDLGFLGGEEDGVGRAAAAARRAAAVQC